MQAVVVARFVFGAEVCVFWFIEQGVFHELLFDFDFDFVFKSQTFSFLFLFVSAWAILFLRFFLRRHVAF